MAQANPVRRWRWGAAALVVALLLSAFAIPLNVTDPDVCVVEWSGSDATLSWLDDGGRHVIRRNGKWLATPGTGAASYVDQNAPAGATYLVRTWKSGTSSDRACTETDPGTTTTTTTTTPPPPPPPPPADACIATPAGTTVTLNWLDSGGNHVIRRNGKWLATPGPGSSSYVDSSAPGGATYVLRTWVRGQSTDRLCTEDEGPPPPPPPPPPAGTTELVVHVSIDALRPDHITEQLMPTLNRLIDEGASTMNARTDPALTRTLPNHTSQLTGRPVWGVSGHQVEFNEDAGTTVHQEAGHYVASAFDVVHDNGGRTVAYAGKSKFAMIDRNWNGANGAADTTGPNDGTDKIDFFQLTNPAAAANLLVDELATSSDLEYAFFHIRYPDAAGHDSGWGSSAYRDAVEASDDVLEQIVTAIETNPDLATTTSIIVVADHGGPTGEFNHGDESSSENYTIPFVVWGPTVNAGADLYALNPGNRADPGDSRPDLTGVQPIRGHEVANLALAMLGYGPVPGSVFNVAQDLRFD